MWAGEAERKVCGGYEMGKNYKREEEKNLSDYINSKDWVLAMSIVYRIKIHILLKRIPEFKVLLNASNKSNKKVKGITLSH